MNGVKYQNNYRQIKYQSSLISSPKKAKDNNYSFNYGIRHYYSAEIKSNNYKAINKFSKPIYIMNPYFLANQASSNKIYLNNELYKLSSPIQVNNNKTVINSNNNVNAKNNYEIRTQKTFTNNINPKLIINTKHIDKNYNLYNNNTVKSINQINSHINNKFKERSTYNQYSYQNLNKLDLESNFNNNLDININNNIINIQSSKIIKNKNFNKTEPNLKMKQAERKTYQEKPKIQPFNLYANYYNNDNPKENIVQKGEILYINNKQDNSGTKKY